jgi:hypothetical protein
VTGHNRYGVFRAPRDRDVHEGARI